jgi:glycosyltransferase involved in cell wall biosynthesis
MATSDPVTIGLPFYNCERTLAYALQSVFAQTYPDWQLLLVDDGSTDGSLAIARQVRDPRVVVIVSASSGNFCSGTPASMRSAVRRSSSMAETK